MKPVSAVIAALSMGILLCSAQNPLPLLRVYHYDTDNNEIDFEQELRNNAQNLSHINIYFRYHKNPLYNQTFSPVKIMLFKVYYEYLVQLTITDTTDLNFTFPLEKHQKVVAKKAMLVQKVKDVLQERPLKGKYYDASVSDSSVVFHIDRSALTDRSVMRIYWKTESAYFHHLWVPSLNPLLGDDSYLSLNIPEIFSFHLTTRNFELLASSDSEMVLKQFSYDPSRLAVDINVVNKTFKWKLPESKQPWSFAIKTIRLPERIGTSVEELLKLP